VVAEAVRSDAMPPVDYWPRGAAAELFRRRDTEVILSGPAGTGKTYGALWRLHLAALKYPGMRGILLRKVQEDLTASAVVTYRERVLTAGRWGVVPFGGSKIKPAGFHYPNGSQLLIGGLDKADKVMSRDYDLIYVNECWEIAEDDWQKLTTRINRPGRVMPFNQLIGDTNPQAPSHWAYQRAYVAEKTAMLPSTHRDNPLLWDDRAEDWTGEGRAYLDTLGKLSGYLRARLLEGQWVAAEGAVYPAFDRRVHVRPVDCDGWATILALDVGTRNPTALLTIRHAGDRIHVEREVYRAGMGSDDILDAVQAEAARAKAAYVVADPSAAGVITSLVKRGVKARKAVNDVAEGIRRVTSVLPDLTIDPACPNLIREIEGYHYPANGAKDAPVKEDDHGADALRYGVVAVTGASPTAAPPLGIPQRSVHRRDGYFDRRG
jgi:PBSX family phage terminase large subunit